VPERTLRIWIGFFESFEHLGNAIGLICGRFFLWHNEGIIEDFEASGSDLEDFIFCKKSNFHDLISCLRRLTFNVAGAIKDIANQRRILMSKEASAGEKAFFLVLGAMIGAATALLLAPRSGPETRKMILTKAREGADLVVTRSKNVAGKTSEYVDRGKEMLQQQRNSLAAALEAGKQAYKDEKEKA
jgi:gas vesicle protein